MRLSPLGDCALRVEFGETISPETNQQIRSFTLALESEGIVGVNEWVPTYCAVTLYYDPLIISYNQLKGTVLKLKEHMETIKFPPPKVFYIPTYYGGEMGPDLVHVANYHYMKEEQVISLHSCATYLIYMIGFTPGFPYLGGMSQELATPRLATPRKSVPAGSVGVAGQQTGIYPIATPGGWQIIGRTPLSLYDPNKKPPILLEAGNYLKFYSITLEEYRMIENAIEEGYYQPRIEWWNEGEGFGCIK